MEPTAIMELNFPSIKDEDISIGTYVILWDEIPVKKIGPNLYEVYTDLPIVEVNSWEEEMEERMANLRTVFSDFPTKAVFFNFYHEELEPNPKYIRTSKGTKRVRPWESPKFF